MMVDSWSGRSGSLWNLVFFFFFLDLDLLSLLFFAAVLLSAVPWLPWLW